jgi:hypothetical protein
MRIWIYFFSRGGSSRRIHQIQVRGKSLVDRGGETLGAGRMHVSDAVGMWPGGQRSEGTQGYADPDRDGSNRFVYICPGGDTIGSVVVMKLLTRLLCRKRWKGRLTTLWTVSVSKQLRENTLVFSHARSRRRLMRLFGVSRIHTLKIESVVKSLSRPAGSQIAVRRRSHQIFSSHESKQPKEPWGFAGAQDSRGESRRTPLTACQQKIPS